MLNSLKNRKKYYELIRIIAILAVMFSHTPGFNSVAAESGLPFVLEMLFAISTRASVPLFFMVSGALLLNRTESISLIMRRFFRFAVCLVFFSFLVYLKSIAFDFSKFWLKYFLYTLYSDMHSETYWFLYSYLSFILMLPFIRKLASAMSNIEFRYMILFALIIGAVRDIQFVISTGELQYSNGFEFFIIKTTVLYPLLGYYIENRTRAKYFTKKTVSVLIISSIAAFAITCVCTRYCINCIIRGVNCQWSDLLDSLRLVIAFSLMYFAKYLLPGNCTDKTSQIMALVSSGVFGAYLFEPLVRTWTESIYYHLEPICGIFIASKVWVLATLFTGCAITILLKRFKIFRKLL